MYAGIFQAQRSGHLDSYLASGAGIFLRVVFLGAITYGVYKDMTGGKAAVGDAISRGMARCFSLIGLFLVFLAGACIIFFVGMIPVFIIGMISAFISSVLIVVAPLLVLAYWICKCCVATSVCVVEGMGAVKSITRSADLVKGHGWSIFALFVITGLGFSAITHSASFFFPSGSGGGKIVLACIQPFLTAFQEVLFAVLYYQLRVSKEGVSVDRLAAVFD
jgi:hypothetical protein